MRGAVAVTARLDDVTILSGAESLTLYEFNTRTAKHYFCRICGIHTFHQRRSNPGEYGVNLACLAGMSPFDLAEVTVTDGVHHTSDSEDGKKRVVGVLRFMAGKTSPCV
ncbi:aldehyde-activating protein [Polymorphobacter glacialis]|uniref:Aldehyde-activating protein n=2 Tax=Sandarakinorhabdus glacialis TaxID=1614636 RepID=A0A916ZSB7_9SPHN|nr:aldehyde-activating protein [Polymorphobacter glacialis]